MAMYPDWKIDTGSPPAYLSLLAVIIVVTMLWWQRETWLRPWFFAFSYFVVVMLPMLEFAVQYRRTIFCTLASMGPLALAGAGMARFADFLMAGRRLMRIAVTAGLVLILGIWSWERAWVFQDEEALWTDTLAKNPSSWVARNGLGYFLYRRGEVDQAIEAISGRAEDQPKLRDGDE